MRLMRVIQLKEKSEGQRNGSVVKSTGRSSKGPTQVQFLAHTDTHNHLQLGDPMASP